MKKVLLFSALLILGCSEDENSNIQNITSENALVDTFTYSYIDNDTNSSDYGNQVEVIEHYNYIGNKLVSIDISFDGNETIGAYSLEYNDVNQITKYNIQGGDSAEYEYDEFGRVIIYTYTDVDDFPTPNISIGNYTYNQDGTVSFAFETDEDSSDVYYLDQNGNIIRVTNVYNTWDGSTQITTYLESSYDNKNNPFKNVLGESVFVRYGSPISYGDYNNNVISTNGNPWFYTYNEYDFPITINSPLGLQDTSDGYWNSKWINIQADITYTSY